MARYIDAEYVIGRLAFYIEDIGYEERINKRYSRITVEDAMALVEDAPIADVRPERYGHWVWNPDNLDLGHGAWQCSECHAKNDNLPYDERIDPMFFVGSKYCPNCGAKMDGEDDNNND